MGLWSCTASDERAAADWLATLLKDGWPAVRQALLPASTPNPQDLTLGQVTLALCAAIIVGAALGKPDPELPASAAQWVRENRAALDPSLVPLARAALDRAEAHFTPYWGEGDEELGYQTEAEQLRQVLG